MSIRRKRAPLDNAFAKRIAVVVEKTGGLTRLAEKAGVTPSSISRYAAGTASPSLTSASALAQAGEVSLDWLGLGRGLAKPAAVSDESVPFYDVQASAGPGLLAADQSPASQTIALPIGQIRRQTGVMSSDLCALVAEGDSMQPTIQNRAVLLLDRASTQPREGVFVLLRGDDILVKRIQPRGPHLLRLISDNKRYEEEDVSLDDPSASVKILGRVIWVGQPI